MRCHWGTALKSGVLFFVLVFLYMYLNLFSAKTSETSEEKLWAREIVSQQLRSDRNLQVFHHLKNDFGKLNMSYTFLAGYPKTTLKYLTVGLSSVKRKNGFYLLDTLQSIFSQSSEEELQDMVVVVLLADFDMTWNQQVLSSISERFSSPILKGQLLVIHLPQEYYPPLEGLKRNFNDAPDRVTFRSKQNVDYAFLLSFSANLSQYYLMLEDDVLCSRNFLTTIRMFIQSRGGSAWVTLEFSKLGYIGKLYHSSDLPRLASFLLLFYQEMPCDWLLGYFTKLLAQNMPIHFKPSLFQHVGLYSSFRGTYNHLKDEDFEANPLNVADNPPADVVTDIIPFKEYTPEQAYSSRTTFFWGKSPLAGSHFTVIFHTPAIVTRISVQTGLQDRKDILTSAEVEVGRSPVHTERGPTCSQYAKLGPLVDGQFDRKDIEGDAAVSCLRILVTKSQEQWVIIRSVNVWTKEEK
ncbi:alpha-1,3-mannosyl-glycoprotein 4-beta-N-acetylglucosaminyltransferase C-like isoform X2 [Scleropages formosus]|uniref:Alpha-1,3-mannosyl-glycoprotein 4-beta-N-acetylglucosaminyltransferase C-like n=1 Tax=Scleropages formosus TaxID=113540 RepID=A0A8C9RJY4_SCLFO|nr:alpha-1,3-mannosyl-glycoprotein 4-beta-N-acetylglucosaminyltransferase C-like isoform X2 [Scleropages formosus]XP_018597516.1 alpha-1,3-mannosyl-glycoprotein 4-beta-N-acetylglucosaminyltransferase C-like isoform X2 [Scleropages formosus]XP_018597517.1 alpha-1,3-mannosyl-glycoprotein 4-beta-N-acetylglucosaminyltransferase C-like isoform X2 [Scleropages formosus]